MTNKLTLLLSYILPMFVVDRDIGASKREQTEWLKLVITTVRIDSMQEAIEELTEIECDIIRYFIENHGLPLSYDKIYSSVRGQDCDKADHKSLWNYIFKNRKKSRKVVCEKEYIITERDTSYRVTTKPDK